MSLSLLHLPMDEWMNDDEQLHHRNAEQQNENRVRRIQLEFIHLRF